MEMKMNHNFDAARIHREQIETEIETIRVERELVRLGRGTRDDGTDGRVTRLRVAAGRALVNAGTSIAGRRAGISRLDGRGGRSARPA
jgi:hypothetical protein